MKFEQDVAAASSRVEMDVTSVSRVETGGDATFRLTDASPRIRSLVEWAMRAFGLDFLLVSGRRGSGIGRGEILATTMPRAYLANYLDGRCFEHDPVVHATARAAHVVRPGDIRALATSDPRAAERLAALQAHRLPVPHVVPLRRAGEVYAACAFGRHRPFDEDEIALLAAASPAMHARLAASEGSAAARKQLSSRERQCVAWAAAGKTAWETGEILGVSEHTVVAHLRNAARKLDAVNRPHLVAEALRTRAID
jgi:LuxR family quorum sensing-dependent transcriptional regulator